MKNLNAWIFGIIFGLSIGALLLSDVLMSKVALEPTELFPNGTPKQFKLLTGLRATGGSVFEFFDKEALQKYSVVLADFAGAGDAPLARDVIAKLVERQAKDEKLVLPELALLTQTFLSAQFDPARAYEFSEVALPVKGKSVIGSRFLTNKGANYLLVVKNIPGRQISILVLKKDVTVDGMATAKFLELLPEPIFSPSAAAGVR